VSETHVDSNYLHVSYLNNFPSAIQPSYCIVFKCNTVYMYLNVR